jgi:acetylornithine/succinyldiaminopimelate/putrescine aminotransferase/predicted amino acid dehydrogenase
MHIDADTGYQTQRASILSPFEQYLNPFLGQLLRNAHLDKQFVRGEGCHLWDSEGFEYLDFVGAHGALPFGFHPPEILDSLEQFCRSQEPSFVQPSMLGPAGELARRLIEVAPAGLRYVTFTNSGAESIEAAIKLARSATQKPGILSTENGFHGKTLGALSATGRPIYQRIFGAPVPGFYFVPYGDLDALGEFLCQHASDIAAFIVEPIQGEGGINVPPPGYLSGASEMCRQHGVLLICDEVQTGLGRTGSLFACSHDELQPDILTLAKALGGGILPIGAVLSTADCLNEEFALKHTSTFSGNALACRVGLRSLELLTRGNGALVTHVAETSSYFVEQLETLQERFPSLIKSVRGRGFLLGLELTGTGHSFGRQCLMSCMAEQGNLVLGIASYLLNMKRIRVAPTLFASRTMRIEPPLVADRRDVCCFLSALEEVLQILDTCDTARFFGHFVDFTSEIAPPPPPMRSRQFFAKLSSTEGRFGFLVHPFDLMSYVDMDQALGVYRPEQLQTLMACLCTCRLPEQEETLVLGSMNVKSRCGATSGEFFVIANTSEEILNLPPSEAASKVREAVRLAAARGAPLVGLGGFTSIVTHNGSDLLDLGIPLTTGNGYTVVSSLRTIEKSIVHLGLDEKQANVAVVGASGSIGRALALLLAEHVGSLTLIARPGPVGLMRLRKVAFDIVAYLTAHIRYSRRQPTNAITEFLYSYDREELLNDPQVCNRAARDLEQEGLLVLVADSGGSLRNVDVIATATSSVNGILTGEMLAPGTVVCEISRPFNVSKEVHLTRPDVLVIDGGLVVAPEGQELGLHLGLPQGLVYGCVAETMVMSLEKRYQHGSIGTDLDPLQILKLEEQACLHGFSPAPLTTSGRQVQLEDWTRLISFRRAACTAAGNSRA